MLKLACQARPSCFSDQLAPHLWNQPPGDLLVASQPRPNVLETRLALLKAWTVPQNWPNATEAVRWVQLLESGWPVFKIFSLARRFDVLSRAGCRSPTLRFALSDGLQSCCGAQVPAERSIWPALRAAMC